MAGHDTRAVGADAEAIARKFLLGRGLSLVTRNFNSRLGEVDLVMLDAGCLVFVEVRYRSGRRLAPARITVDTAKQRKLIRTAALFLNRQQRYSGYTMRFDVVGIDLDDRGRQHIDWLRDAFRPEDSTL